MLFQGRDEAVSEEDVAADRHRIVEVEHAPAGHGSRCPPVGLRQAEHMGVPRPRSGHADSADLRILAQRPLVTETGEPNAGRRQTSVPSPHGAG